MFTDMPGARDLCRLVSTLNLYTLLLYINAYAAFSTLSLISVLLAVPPAYYAHLAAFRARFYMEPDTSDTGSTATGAPAGRGMGAGRSTRAPVNAAVRPLPALKENVKRVMFYC